MSIACSPLIRATGAAIAVLAGVASGAISQPSAAAASLFGSHVLVFNPSMSMSAIQRAIDGVYAKQQNNQFGSARYAILFKPGTYHVDIDVGYYTQILGSGKTPNDTVIDGYLQCSDSSNGNALDNFWRGAENLAVVPTDSTIGSPGTTDMWAVSQACPLRRVHIEGNLALADYGGYASGGFLADSVVDGEVDSWSQQQWLSRNNSYSGWSNGVWNQVFVGDASPPAGQFPNPSYTVIGATPEVREKPFLTFRSDGWNVFAPALRTASVGPSWTSAGSAGPGTLIPIGRFYIAHAGLDTAESINAALASGKDLLLTPGCYDLDEPIAVTLPDTIVLGIGLATIKPEGGQMAMTVSDVDGVDVSGILFDAGTVSSPVLLQVGPPGSSESHAANPITLHDDFFRVGGPMVGRCEECLQINSSNVIGDDFWIWRADHGSGVGWLRNVADNGLVVNGADVTIYGLAVEHFEKYQTLWNGNGGRVYFYQSEAPYDPPTQSSWMAGTEDGYSSYKVADTVTSHRAYGMGVYCYFDKNPSIVLQNAIEAPDAVGVSFTDMVTISLGGVGTIGNIVDGQGGQVGSSNQQADLVTFP